MSDPEKESARPLARVERGEDAIPAVAPQDSALGSLCKSWMRATATDRRLFLADVRAGAANLWREVERDFTHTNTTRFGDRKAARP